MPFFADDLEGAVKGLGASLFPDPARQAQARYMAAHGRQADAAALETQQKTSDLAAKAAARSRLADAIALATREPTPEHASAAASLALAADMKPNDIASAFLGANALAGSRALPAQTRDVVGATMGGPAYATSQSGQAASLQNTTTNQIISSGPQYQQAALDRLKYADTRVPYTDSKGNTIYLRPDETPGPDFQPTKEANTIRQQEIASGPGNRTAALAEQAPHPYIIPDASMPNGQRVTYVPANQRPPEGAVPLDPTKPVETAGVATLFGRGPIVTQSAPAQSVAAPAPGAPAPGGSPAPQVAPPVSEAIKSAANLGNLPKQEAGAIQNDPRITRAIDARLETYNKENASGLSNALVRPFALDSATNSALRTRAAQLQVDRNSPATFARPEEALNQAWDELMKSGVQQDVGHIYNPNQTSSYLRGGGTGATTGGTTGDNKGKTEDNKNDTAPVASAARGHRRTPSVAQRTPQPAPAAAQPAPSPVAAALPGQAAAPAAAQPAPAAPQPAPPTPQPAQTTPQPAPPTPQPAPSPVAAALSGPAANQTGVAARYMQQAQQAGPPPAPPPEQRVPGNFYTMGGHVVQWGSNNRWMPPQQAATQ